MGGAGLAGRAGSGDEIKSRRQHDDDHNGPQSDDFDRIDLGGDKRTHVPDEERQG
jgi:hypothetical protein